MNEPDPALNPVKPFTVYQRVDGSLGSLSWLDNVPFIATPGSFPSEQAKRATALLRERYVYTFTHPDRTKTYLFESIYAQDRIVVDCGKREDLVLLASIDTATGRDEPLPDANAPDAPGFPVGNRHDGIADYRTLIGHAEANAEGFVVTCAGKD